MVPWLMLWMAAGAAGDSSAAARASLGSGSQLMQVERYAEAAEEFRKALRDDRALTAAPDQLAICYFELRDYAHARPLLEQMLLDKRSAGVAAYYLGRIDLIDRDFNSAVRRFRTIPREHPVRDELYYLGASYFKQEKYAESVRVLQQAAAQNPRDSRVHQLLARAYQKSGQAAAAEKEFAETRRLHDYYLEGSAAIARCRALLAQDHPEAARATCRPLMETDDVDKIAAIGMLFGEAKQFGPALEAWQKAVGLDADSAEIQCNLALTCFHLKDMLRAREHAAEAVRQRPDFVEANILYGTILYMGAEDGEALRVLTHAHDLKPDDDSVRRLLAEELAISADRHMRNQEWQQSVAVLEKAAALQPESPQISRKLAEARQRLAKTR